MKAHLTLDAVSGGTLIAAAALLDDEDPEVRATLAGIGLWEVAAALMTHTVADPRRVDSADCHRDIRPGLACGQGGTDGRRSGGYAVPAPQGL